MNTQAFLLFLFAVQVKLITGTIPGNMYSSSLILYSSTTAMQIAVTHIFTVPFATAYLSAPMVAFSLNQYSMMDQFYVEAFNAVLGTINTSNFTVLVTPTLTTNVKLYSICYLIVWNFSSAFWTISRSYPMANNISSGTVGNRSVTNLEYYSFSDSVFSNYQIFPLLNGFHIESSSVGFLVDIHINITNIITFAVTIFTGYDCLLKNINVVFLFVHTPNLATEGITMSSAFIGLNSSAGNVKNYTIYDSAHNLFFIGLRGFSQHPTSGSQNSFGWSMDTNASNQRIQFGLSHLESMNYYILSFTQNKSTVPSVIAAQTSVVPIVVGIAVGGLLLAVVLAIIYLRFSKKTQDYNPPKKDNSRELPSLTF